MKITRRGFIISGAAIGGGLVLGISLWPEAPLRLKAKDGEVILNGWVKINRDGTVVVMVPQAEMGQGVTTSLPMLLADELDADFKNVSFEFAPVDGVYANTFMVTDGAEGMSDFMKPIAVWAGGKIARLMDIQATGGSTTIRQFYEPLRQAGAAARSVLVEAAAKRLAVSLDSLSTDNGFVVHKQSGQKLSYGELVDEAATIKPSNNVKLKTKDQFKFIGKPTKRLDIPAKVTGKAEFGLDVRLPNMVYAAVRAAPSTGGVVANVDLSPLDGNENVIKAVVKESFVAVVAKNYWYAKKAVEELDIEFSNVPNISSKELDEKYNYDLENKAGHMHREDGDMEALLANDGKWFEARYDVPFLAHACLEPMNCTAHVKADSCEIWTPTQSSGFSRSAAAKVLDMDKDNITIHSTFVGGGFGRKLEVDAQTHALEVAKELDVPVQLIWTREEDTKHDMFRPKFAINMAGYIADDGKILALKTKGTGQSVEEGFESRILGGETAEEPGPDAASVEGIDNTPYEFPNIWVEHVGQKAVVPVGFWRSVGHSNNGFFIESFVDELALETKKDPFVMRRELLANNKRSLKVLDILEDKAKWRGPQATTYKNQKSARGMALHHSFGSIVGQVVDVVVEDGAIRVEKVVMVVDCGQVVNPDTVVAQMESGLVYGLTAALYGEINFENGDVIESNFHDYEAVKMSNSPEIITHIIADGHPLGGVGEPSTPPIAPAVANALFAATGERVRKLPLKNSIFSIA